MNRISPSPSISWSSLSPPSSPRRHRHRYSTYISHLHPRSLIFTVISIIVFILFARFVSVLIHHIQIVIVVLILSIVIRLSLPIIYSSPFFPHPQQRRLIGRHPHHDPHHVVASTLIVALIFELILVLSSLPLSSFYYRHHHCCHRHRQWVFVLTDPT
jgi:hypothetical protein